MEVGGRVLEEGDWSGPGGARRVLREIDAEIALLETARGGLLRRGLGVERAQVAIVTNVAADHLGEWGVADVHELAEAKLVVARAAEPSPALMYSSCGAGSVSWADPVTDSSTEGSASAQPSRRSTRWSAGQCALTTAYRACAFRRERERSLLKTTVPVASTSSGACGCAAPFAASRMCPATSRSPTAA